MVPFVFVTSARSSISGVGTLEIALVNGLEALTRTSYVYPVIYNLIKRFNLENSRAKMSRRDFTGEEVQRHQGVSDLKPSLGIRNGT